MVGESRPFFGLGAAMYCERIWAVRSGSDGQADGIFLNRNQLAISFAEASEDLSALPPTRGAFKEAFARSGEARPASIPSQAGQLYRFVHEMRIGDRIIYPRRIDRTLHWGEVTGPYLFETEASPDFAHRRTVRWINSVSRDSFSPGALYEMGSTLTLFEVKTFAEEFRGKFENNNVKAPLAASACDEAGEIDVVRDVRETTRDFIVRKIKTDLKGFPFEPFMADLFRAMGYKAHATRNVKDDGVDIIAHRDELGIEPPILKIQVKVVEANVGADSVKAFYAMVQERDVGIFVTTGGYSSSATSFANTKGNLKLMNGVELVDLIQKYYDGLDAKFRKQIPLRRILVPDIQVND
jgi:restriction system protein